MPRLNHVFIRQVGVARWGRRTAIRQFSKRVLHRDLHMKLPTGLRIVLPRHSQFGSEAYITGANVDVGAEALLARYADRRRDFLDIGANIGYYSLYLSPRVRSVYAFEPDGRSLPVLHANAQAAGNVQVVEKVVAQASGEVFFDVTGSTELSHIASEGDVAVMATCVDDFVAESGADVGQVKIDVEGHDIAVLKGARRTLRDAHPLVLTEFSQRASGINETDELYELCDELEYHVYGAAYYRSQNPSEATLCRMSVTEKRVSKMLFLVPPRLHEAFADEASRDSGRG